MKKIIAIAIAVGLSAPAIADTTVYGQLHASIDALDGAVVTRDDDGLITSRTNSSGTSVSSNSSRIGVKGSSQLNYGLKAIYKAEWGIDTGNGGKGAFTNRNQVVGLAGRRGAVLIGRHDTPLKIIGRKADLFWSTQLGQNRNIVNPGVWDLRPDNVIAYQSPKWRGIQMLAAYVTRGVEDDTNHGAAVSFNAIYNAGPLMLGAAYEEHAGGSHDPEAVRLMAAYKFGRAKLVGFYQNEDYANAPGANDADVLGIGLAYKTSPNGTLKGQYYVRDEDNAANDGKLFAIGYDHKLGKKTDVYAQYAVTSDLDGIGGAGHGEFLDADTSGDASGFSMGIRHKF